MTLRGLTCFDPGAKPVLAKAVRLQMPAGAVFPKQDPALEPVCDLGVDGENAVWDALQEAKRRRAKAR